MMPTRIGNSEFKSFSRQRTNRTEPVFWAFPMDEVAYSRWVVHMLGMAILPTDVVGVTLNTLVGKARNILHGLFLDSPPEVKWMMMLDSDIVPPFNLVEKLLARDKKMICGWYRNKNDLAYPAVYSQARVGVDGVVEWNQWKQPREKGYDKVDGAGAGCWLMHRSVAEAIGRTPYDFLESGEDLGLCLKVRRAGFSLYVDWESPCKHIGVGEY